MQRWSRGRLGLAVVVAVGLALAATAPAQSDETRSLEARAVALVEDLAAGRFEAACARFDTRMKDAAPPARMAEIWEEVTQRLGAYRESKGSRREPAPPYEIVYVRTRFARATVDVKVVFDRTGAVSGFFFTPVRDAAAYRAPPYVDRTRFTEQEVAFGEEDWKLPGTFSRPVGDGPFPAVVLVHGSGPNDRNETVGGHQPFKDLAWGLASRGVAVLRYEKRTRAHSARMAARPDLTVAEETVTDAGLAAAFLAGRADVGAGRVFVLGHSLGGMLIPRIATAAAEAAAGFIVMAGPTRPLEDLILAQTRYIYGLDGEVTAVEEKRLAALAEQVARVKSPDLKPDTPPDRLPMGILPAYWLDLRGYRPAAEARAIDRPLLILQGERDYQVTMEDFAGWREALDGRERVTLRSFPALNHLFVPGEGRSTPAEYEAEGHVAEEVIRTLADWVKERA